MKSFFILLNAHINFAEYFEIIIYLIIFIIALRAIHFLTIKKDPINAIKKSEKHWVTKAIEKEQIEKTVLDRG